MLRNASQANNTSKDAMTFAPCFRSAKNSDSVYVTDIVFAVSVFLCLIISIICVLSILDICITSIIGIIILNLALKHKDFIKKKQSAGMAC